MLISNVINYIPVEHVIEVLNSVVQRINHLGVRCKALGWSPDVNVNTWMQKHRSNKSKTQETCVLDSISSHNLSIL